jgi:hypothetical protein
VVKDAQGAVLPGVTVEATSPALIEKVRSVITDGTGQYQIVDLRPGTYSVSFMLTGFNVVKRDGIEIAGAFAATVNVDLTVGSLNETITVTGESPTVDVQNTKRSNVIPADVIDALPARSQYMLAVLTPGAIKTGGVQDVGGTRTMQITTFSIHGSRPFDQRLMINGITSRNLLSSAWASNFVPDMGTAAEVVIDYSSGTSESVGGGMGMNVIPKEGGNRFVGSFFVSGANGSMQSNNVTDELIAQGLTTPNKLKRVYDVNPSGGGPVFKDRLWFYASLRFQESSLFQAGAFANKNGGDLSKWTYEPDLDKPGEGRLTVLPSGSVRLTWQATPRNKIAFSAEPQVRHWINALAATFSPEIYPDWQFNHESLTTGTWTSPVTSRLLLEARYANHAEGFVDKYPEADDPYRRAIPVREATTGFLYRGKGYCCLPVFFGTQNAPFTQQASASMSYITGSHALKVGFQNDFGNLTQEQFDNEYGLFYTFNNGVPTSIQQHALPFAQKTHLSLDMGIYAQDRWTFKQATINGGVRLDFFKNKFPEQVLGPASFVPNRNIVIPETPYASLKDITPRIGVAYDLFGNGRTSLRSSWGKYMIGLSPLAGNPVSLLAYVANRSWTPSLPPGHPNYYTPQCDLNSTLANGDCGALDNALFGQLRPSAAIDPRTITGWGNRAWNQEFSVSVQQQIMPRVAVDAGYFRRWFGNFQVVDNRAVGPDDYTRYSIVVPTDSRLPESGQTISGLYELVPGKVGQVDNYTTFAKDYGKQIEHWNGVDVNVTMRLGNGTLLQGGTSTGRTTTDTCDIVAKVDNPSARYCHVDTKFLTQVKFLGTYVVPKADVQIAATFRSLPGTQILANYVATNAEVQPSLGRPLSGGAANVTVNIVEPGTMYSEQTNLVDLRFSKIFRFGAYRTSLNLDLANAFISSGITALNNNYAAWQVPTGIHQARLVKLSANFDF